MSSTEYRYIIDDIYSSDIIKYSYKGSPEVYKKTYMSNGTYYTRDESGVIILDQTTIGRGKYIIQDEYVLKALTILYHDLDKTSINLFEDMSFKKVQYDNKELPLITLEDVFKHIGINPDIEMILLKYNTALLDKCAEIHNLKVILTKMISSNTGIDKDVLESLSIDDLDKYK